MSIWDVLGIDAGSNREVIRRAYARKLKLTNPEDDPEGFKTLRAAYEAALDALRHAEWSAQWDGEGEEDPEDEEAPAHARWTEGAAEAHTPDADRAPETARPDEREIEIAELQARIDALAHALNGPWGSQDDQLHQAFVAVLQAPIMADIGIHARAEDVLAGMLANAIPTSDPLLPMAVEAFGWEEAAHARNMPPAIIAILDRIEEWGLIQAMQQPGHQLNDAWRTLTSAPKLPWRMRILALTPGLPERVGLVLAHANHRAIGLSHSLHPAASTWWETYLSGQPLALGAIVGIPIGLIFAVLAAWALAGSDTIFRFGVPLCIAALGLAWPMVHRRLQPLRERLTEQAMHGRWRLLLCCWLPAILLAPFCAMFLPATPQSVTLAFTGALLLFLWAWLAAEQPILERPTIKWTFFAIQILGLAIICGVVATPLPREHLAIFAVVASLLLLVRLAFIRRAATILTMVTPGLVLVIAFGTPIATLAIRDAYGIPTPYLGLLVISALFLLIAIADQNNRSGGEGAVRLWLMRGVLVLVLISLAETSPPGNNQPTRGAGPGTLDTQTLDTRIDDRLSRLEAREPGFRSIRLRNPELHAKLRAAVFEYEDGKSDLDRMNARIGESLDQAYADLLPDASNALLVELFRMRQLRLRAMREGAPELCADESLPPDPTLLPASYNRRSQWLFFAILSKSEYDSGREPGAPINLDKMAGIAARSLGISPQLLIERIKAPKTDAKSACAAKIALLGAIATQPVADIASFMRTGSSEKR